MSPFDGSALGPTPHRNVAADVREHGPDRMSTAAATTSTSRRLALFAAFALLPCLAGGWYLLSRNNASAEAAAPFNPWAGPVPVRIVTVDSGDLALRLRAIGTVVPTAAVEVRSRVEGELKHIAFEEGQIIEQGALLAEIDPAPYQVRLAAAEGELARNLARLKNAEQELERFRRLSAQHSVARQQVDAQEAAVAELRGILKSDRARVDEARLQLSWTRIVAPIGGRLGLRAIDAGNFIQAGDATGLVSITRTRPISALFSIPEHELPLVRAALRAGHELTVEARDRDDRATLARGVLRTLDNRIDSTTGTVRLKAEFANEDDALFPNQFVNVHLDVGVQSDVVTIPADAVQYGAHGSYVYVIDQDRAHVRPIETGRIGGARIVVEQGLTAGERVALEGLDRLRDGREVVLIEFDENRATVSAPLPGMDGDARLLPGG